MSTEPMQASRAAEDLLDELRAFESTGWDGRNWKFTLAYNHAARRIDAALAAEYKRGMMEALECCIGCGATKDDDCHCGETDEVEL